MKIPRSFELINRKIDVIVTEKDEHILVGSNYGYALQDIIQNKYKIVIDKDIKDKTEAFIHEFLHQLFDVIEENELKDNEELIIRMSRVATQAINTMKFKKN